MKPSDCKTSLGLINVNLTSLNGIHQLSPSTLLDVQQKQAASFPITGTFSLSYEDKHIEGNTT